MNGEGELELLLSAMGCDPDRFRQRCGRVDDWNEIFRWAMLHSVESLLQEGLSEIGFKLPPAIEERLHRWQLVKDLWQSHSQTALNEALQTLHSASIHAVALKGPVLGERVYAASSMRLSADLDLLVSSADLESAAAALQTIGYGTAKESEARFLRKYHYHVVLSRAAPPVIELHFRLSDKFGTRLPAEGFLGRSQAYQTERGAIAYVLSPEDEMLYLSVHAAGHQFLRLSWLCDIRLLLRRHPQFDWQALMERARSLNVLSPLLFTCEMLQTHLGVKLPELDGFSLRGIRSRAATFLLAATRHQPNPSRKALLGHIAFVTVLCDGPLCAARFLSHQLFLVVRRRARRHFPSLAPEEWSY